MELDGHALKRVLRRPRALDILRALSQRPMYLRELVRELGIPPKNALQNLRLLKELDLVEKRPALINNRWVSLYHLTPQGREFVFYLEKLRFLLTSPTRGVDARGREGGGARGS